jgi:3-deoxy-manno-octulosonate cytidylyltransferase (CMP-KDO synthetase)
MSVIGIIPARYGSTRFPGKPLALIGGKTMIRRTYERAALSSLDAVVVATDDQRILDEVLAFGGRAVMTRSDHRSGTDRCREALDLTGEAYDAVVNIQGDEPFIDPRHIDCVADLIRQPDVQLATLACKIGDPARLGDPNTVKVVMDYEGDALYFSRHPIPFLRGVEPSLWIQKTDYYQHIGLYAYRVDTLRDITALPAGKLEQAESLEQLRWLERGLKIKVAVTDIAMSYSIDTPDDIRNIPQELLR